MFADPAAFRTHRIDVGSGHTLMVRESGNEAGIAALVLHGGPGSGCSPLLRRFFDPARYRIVCVDQRGAGDSTPHGSIEANTTAHLLADLRRVRTLLGITRWLVVGGSWGATLALLHALDDPDAVSALLLRGTWLARDEDIAGFFAGAVLGDGRDSGDLDTRLAALAERLHHGSADAQRGCALAWWRWEQRMARPAPSDAPAPARSDASALAPMDIDALIGRYRVQIHYLRHRCWLRDEPLLARCARLPKRPIRLLHGSDDRICPADGARALQRVLPHVALQWVAGAGHDPSHPAMVDAMVRALDGYATHGALADGLSG